VVPAYTWVATYSCAAMLGADVIVVDCDPHTSCLDQEALQNISFKAPPGKRCVIPVHMFGLRCGEGWIEK